MGNAEYMGTYHRCLASDRLGLRRALIADDKTHFFGFIREKTKQGHVCTIHHGLNGLSGAGGGRPILLLSFLPDLFCPILLLSYLPYLSHLPSLPKVQVQKQVEPVKEPVKEPVVDFNLDVPYEEAVIETEPKKNLKLRPIVPFFGLRSGQVQ